MNMIWRCGSRGVALCSRSFRVMASLKAAKPLLPNPCAHFCTTQMTFAASATKKPKGKGKAGQSSRTKAGPKSGTKSSISNAATGTGTGPATVADQAIETATTETVSPTESAIEPSATKAESETNLDPDEEVAEIGRKMDQALSDLQKGEFKQAISTYEAVIAQFPNIEAYYHLGLAHWLSKDMESAERVWLNVLRFSNEMQQAQLAGSPDKLEEFQRIENSIVSATLVNLANFNVLHDNVGQALDYIRQAEDIDPVDGEIQFNYGLILEKNGQSSDALAKFERAKELGISHEAVDPHIRNSSAKAMNNHHD